MSDTQPSADPEQTVIEDVEGVEQVADESELVEMADRLDELHSELSDKLNASTETDN